MHVASTTLVALNRLQHVLTQNGLRSSRGGDQHLGAVEKSRHRGLFSCGAAAEAAGCPEEYALAFDGSLDKPSVFTAPFTAGAHTVVLINLGPEADTLSYRFEITDRFGFLGDKAPQGVRRYRRKRSLPDTCRPDSERKPAPWVTSWPSCRSMTPESVPITGTEIADL